MLANCKVKKICFPFLLRNRTHSLRTESCRLNIWKLQLPPQLMLSLPLFCKNNNISVSARAHLHASQLFSRENCITPSRVTLIMSLSSMYSMCEGLTSVEEENEAIFIRVWKPSPSLRVLKILRGSLKGKAQ